MKVYTRTPACKGHFEQKFVQEMLALKSAR